MNKSEVRSPPHTFQKRKQCQGVINVLDNVEFIPQASNPRVKKLYGMCLRTTKQ